MEERIDLLIGFFFYGLIPAAIIVILHFRNKMKHKERLAMIEKGLDISTVKNNEDPIYQILMWGLLLSGAGLGSLFGYILSLIYNLDKAVMVPIMAIIFGGIGLILFYKYKK